MSDVNSLFESAHKGDYELVKTKVDENINLITHLDDSGRILLHWAALSGNVKLVQYLLEKDSPIDQTDDTDCTPLILASSAGRVEVVRYFITKGANVNHKTNQGHSALQYACSKGWAEVAENLLESCADINIADIRGATPLHRAASKGNLVVVKLLLKHKDDAKLKIDAKDIYGNTALHLACEEDRQDEAKLLIENGADVEVSNLTESSGERTKTLRNLENEVQKSRQIDLCGVPPKIDCRPREAYVKIVADNNKHKLFSNLVLIKRCSGYCDSKVCKPTKKENVIVRVISSKGECQQHSVEEHLECKCFREVKCENKSNCGCEGKKNSDCTSLKKWNNRICRCICKNKKSICSTGSKWDDKECRCSKNLKLK